MATTVMTQLRAGVCAWACPEWACVGVCGRVRACGRVGMCGHVKNRDMAIVANEHSIKQWQCGRVGVSGKAIVQRFACHRGPRNTSDELLDMETDRAALVTKIKWHSTVQGNPASRSHSQLLTIAHMLRLQLHD